MGDKFHENLKIAREKKNMTQKEVADSIGVAKSTYSLYESGNREPNVQTIKKIANTLNVSADDLLGLNDFLRKEPLMTTTEFIQFLLERFQIEWKKRDRSGIYGFTQRLMAYNSNKIEGSTLTEEQTASLFDTGTLPKSDDYYRAKDVEEMNGHFLMFNKMMETYAQPLSQDLIKQFHYELKSGVFEDRANGYAIGDYKKRPNMVGMYETVLPSKVPEEMTSLFSWYNAQKDITLEILAEFHVRYESIHPFQDGNGRTGRLILFRECLRHGISPLIIEDAHRPEYLDALKEYRQTEAITKMIALFHLEQDYYWNRCQYFMAE